MKGTIPFIKTVSNAMIVMEVMMIMMMAISYCHPLQTIFPLPLLLHHHHRWMIQQPSQQQLQEQLLRRDFIQQVTTTIIGTAGITSSPSSSSTTSLLPITTPTTTTTNHNMIVSDTLSSSSSNTFDSSSTLMISKNLPDTYSSNNFQKVGTVEALYPIVQMKQSTIGIQNELSLFTSLSKEILIKEALNELYNNIVVLTTNNKNDANNKKEAQQSSQFADVANTKSVQIPINEASFKRIFDEYSTPISYKQQYLNNNAFLIYYTKGYDGRNRPNIETCDNSMMLQTIQYGLRNDIWIKWDELINELQYQISDNDTNVQELITLLQQTIQILNQYLDQTPIDDVQTCYNQLSIVP